jgi:phosphoglycerate kinase
MKPMINYVSKAHRKALAGVALLRLDFNTKDDWRMEAVLPTVKLLARTSSKVVIVSHRGRPTGGEIVNGTPKGFPAELHLKRDAVHLAKFIKHPIKFFSHFRFDEIKQKIDRAPRGSIFMLDNLRFLKGEEANDPAFAQKLASLADFYVNDAFAVSHRANASVATITKFLPSYAGIELEAEITSLSKAMVKPARPLVMILGGAKASDKLGVIAFFRRKADWFLLSGSPANSILALKGMDVKRSLREKEDQKTLAGLASIARQKDVVLPVDFIWGKDAIFDIGPKTIALFSTKIAAARTIIWSGPLGFIEKKAYAKGSVAIAKAIGRNRKAFSICGGGETVMFLKRYKLDKKFSFISTGGGAMVDFLAGERLPGIEALEHPLKDH